MSYLARRVSLGEDGGLAGGGAAQVDLGDHPGDHSAHGHHQRGDEEDVVHRLGEALQEGHHGKAILPRIQRKLGEDVQAAQDHEQRTEILARSRILVDYNLLYHTIEIIRDPLMGKPPSAWSWFMVILTAIAGWSFTLYLFARFRRRIPYWL